MIFQVSIMADGASASFGSWLGKFYFVLVHFFLFLVGFYMIQTKAKQEENVKEKSPPKKKEVSEKSIYYALNSYMKSCFLSSRKSSVRIVVDRWLTSVQHNLKKELKNIAEVVGKKVGIFIANCAIFFGREGYCLFTVVAIFGAGGADC